MSLHLKWISSKQHIYGSCFCIHSATLCLLIAAFSPFTCKVIGRNVLIAVVLIIWGLFLLFFFVPFFLFALLPYDLMISVIFGFFFLLCVCIILDFVLWLPWDLYTWPGGTVFGAHQDLGSSGAGGGLLGGEAGYQHGWLQCPGGNRADAGLLVSQSNSHIPGFEFWDISELVLVHCG